MELKYLLIFCFVFLSSSVYCDKPYRLLVTEKPCDCPTVVFFNFNRFIFELINLFKFRYSLLNLMKFILASHKWKQKLAQGLL